ncbi:hypothetical protein ACP70R_027711 [Stipagrostis hirtigluma subsp. patula]
MVASYQALSKLTAVFGTGCFVHPFHAIVTHMTINGCGASSVNFGNVLLLQKACSLKESDKAC